MYSSQAEGLAVGRASIRDRSWGASDSLRAVATAVRDPRLQFEDLGEGSVEGPAPADHVRGALDEAEKLTRSVCSERWSTPSTR